MDIFKLHLLDLLIVIAYFVICLVIGFYRSKKIKALRQFALGYQNLSPTILVSVIFASSIGGGTLFGDVKNFYLFGLAFLVGKLFIPVCWLLAAKIYSPNINRFNDCISVSQIMFKLYSSPGRWVTNIATVIISIGILAAQALAISYIFYYFFGLNIIYGMLISYGILTAYTALGGIRAVVLTETFQFAIFFLIIPISYVITLTDIGGLSTLVAESSISDLGFEFNAKNTILLASFIFFTILPECNPPFIQRCLMATNSMQLRMVLKTISLLSLPFALSILLIAYIVRVHAPDVPGNEALLFYINYLPVGLKGLMIVGIVAAIMGYAEGWLNASSVIIVNDIVKVLYPTISNKRQLLALRVSVVFLSLASVMLAYFSNNIIQLILIVQNFWIPLILIPLTAGFLNFRTSVRAFVTSIILALTFIFVGRILAGEYTTVSLSMGILGSALGLFGTHFWPTAKTLTILGNTDLLFKWLSKLALRTRNSIATIVNSITSFLKQIRINTGSKEPPYLRFASFTLVYYFSYTFSLTSDPTHRIFSYLLVIGYLMCFILLFRNAIFSSSFQKKYLSVYWHCTLTFCLPLVASYMLFASKGNDFWIINGLLSAFSLYFFTDAITFIILLTVGAFCGYGLFLFNDPKHIVLDVHYTLQHTGYIYLSFVFAYLMLFRVKEKEQEDKIGQMHIFSGAIAHEVKSPIASIIMCSEAVTDILSKSVGAAQNDNNNNYTFTLSKDEYDLLMISNKSIQKAGVRGINTVNSILTSLKSSVVGDEKQLYQIEECIKQAIHDYSLFNSSAKNIEVDVKCNFKVKCSLHYLTHVILNLLKNAHKHGGEDVKIKIWTKRSRLYFEDFGKGIPEDVLPYIFDRFYTGNKTGTGIGLAFCKMVMEDLGGYIECKSKLGKYTKFTLIFP